MRSNCQTLNKLSIREPQSSTRVCNISPDTHRQEHARQYLSSSTSDSLCAPRVPDFEAIHPIHPSHLRKFDIGLHTHRQTTHISTYTLIPMKAHPNVLRKSHHTPAPSPYHTISSQSVFARVWRVIPWTTTLRQSSDSRSLATPAHLCDLTTILLRTCTSSGLRDIDSNVPTDSRLYSTRTLHPTRSVKDATPSFESFRIAVYTLHTPHPQAQPTSSLPLPHSFPRAHRASRLHTSASCKTIHRAHCRC